jgi:hypothetical protein
MSDSVPTIKIVRPDLPGGILIINESDFDPATMTKAEDQPQPAPKGKKK